jgi:hypothetical protein
MSSDRSVSRTPGINLADHVARSLLVLLGIVRQGHVYPLSMVLHKLPGDVSLAFVLQAIAAQEQRRSGAARNTRNNDAYLKMLAQRSKLTDRAGEALSLEQTVGDVPDPGVIVVIVYEDAPRDDVGRPVLAPSFEECRATLLRVAAKDSELSAKLDRHLKSPDATLKARLDL